MSPSRLIDRFTGENGPRLLVECLRSQWIVGQDEVVANALATNATLRELEAGEVLIRQGDADNDIYFVLAGKLKVLVNGREVAMRGTDQHLGEMALVDTSLRRTATNIASEPTVVAKVSEKAFSQIADLTPRLWRALAIGLSRRLHQRERFLVQPNQKPIVFVGSSKESLPIAQAIAVGLPSDLVAVRLWSEDVFGASRFPIEDLEAELQIADFAVLVAAADDQVISRGKESDSPRDNVVFEVGLFMGALTRRRTFIVVPHGMNLRIPTDLLGLTYLEYDASAVQPDQAVAGACKTLSKIIEDKKAK